MTQDVGTIDLESDLQDEDMTEFQELSISIGWSYREIARQLNVSDATVRQWGNGRRDPPANVLSWLRLIAGAIRLIGLPEGWRQASREAGPTHGVSA